MIQNLFYQPLTASGIHYLDEVESRHCIKVLRKRQGDPITVTDGKGEFFDCVITDASDRRCAFDIAGHLTVPRESFAVNIAISPTKSADRIEWFVEKAVEIGVNNITLIDCKNSERSFINMDRLTKVAISAMKQSLKARLPEISPIVSFNDFVTTAVQDEKYIAFVDQTNPDHLSEVAKPGRSYVVLIGPEGDFSHDELTLALSFGFQKVSLGNSRLRTETAGVVACHTLNLVNRRQR